MIVQGNVANGFYYADIFTNFDRSFNDAFKFYDMDGDGVQEGVINYYDQTYMAFLSYINSCGETSFCFSSGTETNYYLRQNDLLQNEVRKGEEKRCRKRWRTARKEKKSLEKKGNEMKL